MNYSYPQGSPGWWTQRLYDVFVHRLPIINRYDDYYRGDFPLPWLAPDAVDEFRRILKMSRAPVLGLVVDAQCERMNIDGFRMNEGPAIGAGYGQADQELQRIWQYNCMDAYFDQAILEAAINGTSYLMVEPNADDPATPLIFVEHASQMVVAFQSGTNRRVRLAALKVFEDEWTGAVHSTLYLPDSVHKFRSKENDLNVRPVDQRTGRADITWMPRFSNEDLNSIPNTVGEVPVWELPNNPRLLSGGQSEIHDLTDSQDRIVKTIADRLMTQDYGAFPQKWATGWPDEDASGNPTEPIKIGRDRILLTDVKETRFGQFTAADINGYLEAKRQDITDIASRSRTPAQYLLGEMSNVNGETLKASESGLVSKVRQRQRGMSDSIEQAMLVVRRLAGLESAGGESLEVIWRNPEFRTEGELTDALVKMADLGVPEEALWERWGASPTEIVRWKAMLDDKMRRAAAGDPTVVLAERYRRAATGEPEAEGTDGPTQRGGAQNREGAA